MRTFLAVLVAAVLAATIGWGVVELGFYLPGVSWPFRIWTTVCWAVFALGLVLLRRVPAKHVAAVVLVGAALIGGAAIVGPPNTSTDSARYAWDGIVQGHGVSPYAHTPNSKATESLRPEWLFPSTVTESDGSVGCTPGRTVKTRDYGTKTVICTQINRPSVNTIYPATAELYFAAVRFVVPTDAQYWPLQAGGLVISLGITVGLVLVLRRRRLDVRWAALWAWCPLVASEAVTNSHVDVLAAGLAFLATALVATNRRWTGGLALGAAIATKLIPVIAAPALLRRQPLKVIAASLAAFLLLYVPYIIGTGPKVLGFLPGYLSEEGYDDGNRFALVHWFAPGELAAPAAVLILLIVAVIVWRVTDPANPWLGQLVMIGATLLVLSPRYPWYALLLIPFVAMTGRWEWLTIAMALSARQFFLYGGTRPLTLLVALVIIVAVSIHRSGPGWQGRMRDTASREWHALLPSRRRPLGAPEPAE
ncbi:glycosyltransferase 87 family protein [Frondihabitans cladoniiphilus]|uniref:glycosyltransferase 87 family protein n=1 Tax=Frondihabitans cladoniiphilus TaxID=715785 RepID=UPI0031E79D2B